MKEGKNEYDNNDDDNSKKNKKKNEKKNKNKNKNSKKRAITATTAVPISSAIVPADVTIIAYGAECSNTMLKLI